MKHVLILGAGLVVKPLLDDLLSLPDVEINLVALNIDRAAKLVEGRERAEANYFDALDEERLDAMVARSSVVVSMLPADKHPSIARACLQHRVPLVTTSYVSDEMRSLDEEARKKGVLLLNECGLDPGIDHMTAAHVFRRVEREGGQVVGFASYCGGIPAPDANTNPWGYKFTWSPRGVVLAVRNAVRFLKDGKEIRRNFPDLFENPRHLQMIDIGRLEAYPTRDCLRYIEPYNLHYVSDFYRGTLRHPGWCETWHALFKLGLLDLTPRIWEGMTYSDFLNWHLPEGDGGLVARLSRELKVSEDDDVISRFEWLGLMSDRLVPIREGSSLDVVSNRLQEKLRYKDGERDLVVLEHQITATRAYGGLRKITERMTVFGYAGDDSAMARTVSYPAAIACRLILDGQIHLSGVRIPVDRQLSEPILLGLARRGIVIRESEEDIA